MKASGNFKLIGISLLIIVGLAACSKREAQTIVGAWRCSGGEYAYLSDKTIIAHSPQTSGSAESLSAGRYKLDGQQLSHTFTAVRFLTVPSSLSNALSLDWTDAHISLDYELVSLNDHQLVTKYIRYTDPRRTVSGDGSLITCEKDDQLFKQFESIRAGIPPNLL